MPSDHLYTQTRALFLCRPAAIRLFASNNSIGSWPRLSVLYHGQSRPSTTKTPSIEIDPLVDVNSLANTVDAYRAANRAPGLLLQYGSKGSSLPTNKVNWNKPKHDRANQFPRAASRSLRNHLTPGSTRKGTVADTTTQWALDKDAIIPSAYRLPWTRNFGMPLSGSPWLSAEEQLSKEIEAFETYVSPTQEEQNAAELAFSDLRRVIKATNKHMDVDIIGSRSTGTADPLSDIDVNVSLPITPSSMKAQIQPDRILRSISSSIRTWRTNHQNRECPIETVLYVKKAVVPILLCRHSQTGLPIQIQSTPRTFDSTEYVRSFMKEFPTLRSLFKVMRQVLHMRDLHNGQHGGLTSYPLLNMIVASLKLSEGKSAPTNSGAHLLHFLDLYCEIDFATMGISTRPLGFFSKDKDRPAAAEKAAAVSGLYTTEIQGQQHLITRAKTSPSILVFQDPANPTNNLGKSAWRIRDVQETLVRLRHQLKLAMEAWDKTQIQEREETSNTKGSATPTRGQSVLRALLEGDYRLYEYDRNDIRKAVQDLNHSATSKIKQEILGVDGEIDVPLSSLDQGTTTTADEAVAAIDDVDLLREVVSSPDQASLLGQKPGNGQLTGKTNDAMRQG
ncbi:uncharacterized protein A1O9_00283 [Exophiala aquamarina CBS 119918]|uniref:Poly(A) RNA polymerase mitochondrial-like central palm domain-containing protein n=1 Tax=Exophiala aquamarina CBS 119918 TaxID=1182545 RepID=A0A072PR34_9EURO|nr:uncharacterized protein A1O9_00283 [Exophiala aquamarina CBS 119918]KEF62311.1 hypothetical protein A1O9_00283 [Exophiala aquamarina CBS 119918]